MTTKPKKPTGLDIRIVVAQRGWVLVGLFSRDGAEVVLDYTAVIRQWGSTKGLGEIAVDGPTDKTVLDPQPRTRLHELTAVLSIECNADQWTKVLGIP